MSHLLWVTFLGGGGGIKNYRGGGSVAEPEPKKLHSFGSGSVTEEDEVKSKL